MKKLPIKPNVYHDAWYLTENGPFNAVHITLAARKAGLPPEHCALLGNSWLEIDQVFSIAEWPDDWHWLEKIGEGLFNDPMYRLPNLFYKTPRTPDDGGEWELDEEAVFHVIEKFKKTILDLIYVAVPDA